MKPNLELTVRDKGISSGAIGGIVVAAVVTVVVVVVVVVVIVYQKSVPRLVKSGGAHLCRSLGQPR